MTENIEDVMLHLQRFGWPDYLVFIIMLLLCVLIGIYFGFVQKSSKNETEYLMGGRNMLIFPIALSLIASFISGITLLGLPTEIYSYGIQYLYVTGGVILMGFIMSYFYLPVFQQLNITSTYEIGYLPIVVYVPALAFNQVTGVNIHIITPIVCIVCVFYTCAGGLKAVVWTDVVQTFSMFGALILVAIKGSIDLGGASIVFEEAWKTERIERPNFDPNPTIRHTIWSQIIGGLFYWLQTNAVSQNMIQRYLALPSLAAGRKALWIFVCGVIILMLLCSYNGLLIYATYRNCDPLTTKLARARDQLLPLFVMDTLGELPGLSGLFIAGVFSAALSSLSTCLNSMSAVVLEDFFKPFAKKPLSNRSINWIMRLVVVGVGISCVALVLVVEKMGTVLQLTMSLEAITNGPLLGIFTMGIFLPWINGNSALIGGIFGVFAMSWVSLNAQWAIASGALTFEQKKTSIDDCSYTFNRTAAFIATTATKQLHLDNNNNNDDDHEKEFDIFPLYRISYMWYTFFGAIVTTIIAIICTLIFGANDPSSINPILLSPIIKDRFVKEQKQSSSSPSASMEKIEFKCNDSIELKKRSSF